MATTAARVVTVTFTGTTVGVQSKAAANNAASPGEIELKTLASGFNTITPPTGGSTVVGCVIVPPAGNTVLLTLKGVTGDTGIPLHKTDPTSLAFDSSLTTFGITAASTCTGVQFIWT